MSSAVRQTDEDHRERGQAHHHKDRSHSPREGSNRRHDNVQADKDAEFEHDMIVQRRAKP